MQRLPYNHNIFLSFNPTRSHQGIKLVPHIQDGHLRYRSNASINCESQVWEVTHKGIVVLIPKLRPKTGDFKDNNFISEHDNR